MAVIPVYQQRTTTPLQGVNDGVRPVETTSYVARGLQQFGAGVGDFAQGRIADRERDDRERKQADARAEEQQAVMDRAAWATIEPDIRLRMVQWREEHEADFPESGEGLADATLAQIDREYDQYRADSTLSPYFRRLIDASHAATRADIGGAAIQREGAIRDNWAAGSVERGVTASVNLIQSAPLDEIDTLYAAEAERTRALIAASDLPPDARANAQLNADTALANALVRRRAEADPAGFLQSAPADASDAERTAMAFFMAQGLPQHVAAGIVGNLVHESNGLDTGAINPGDGNDGSDSIGIAQWNGSRAQGLRAWAAEQGLNPSDLQTQLGYVWHELQTSESGTLQALRGARTAEDAAAAFIGYERPAGWTPGNARGAHGYDNRVGHARRLAVPEAQADPDVVRAERDGAQRELDRREAERLAEIQRQNDIRVNQLEIAISRGEAGYDEIAQAIQEGWLDPSEQTYVSLTRAADTAAEERAEAQALSARVGEAGRGGAALDPTDQTHRDALDADFLQTAARWSPEEFGAQAAQYVARYGMVPASLETQIVTDLRSTDPERRVRAAALYGQMRSAGGPVEEIGTGTDRARLGLLLRYSRAGMSPQQAVEALDQVITLGREEVVQRDAAFRARLQPRAPDRFDAQRFLTGAIQADRRVADARGFWGGEFRVPEEMRSDLETLALAAYREHGDMQAAYETAYDQLRQTWAPSAFNGRQWMRNAPEAVYGLRSMTAGENAQWIREQLVEDVPGVPADELRLIEAPTSLSPDGGPLYYVMRATDGGLDHVERGGSPIFWRPDYAGSQGARDAQGRQDRSVEEARAARERDRERWRRTVESGGRRRPGEF